MDKSSLQKLCIITLNVRGLRNIAKRQLVFTWLKNHRFDIVCLQKTYCTRELISDFDKRWGSKTWHSESISNHSRGVCIMINPKLNYQVIMNQCDTESRKVFLKIKIGNNIINILNIYAPNNITEKKLFFNNLYQWTEEVLSGLVVSKFGI